MFQRVLNLTKKKYFFSISSISVFCLLFLIVIISETTHAAGYERINSFATEISIKSDGSFDVFEKISYEFSDARHGIYRCIPKIHQDKASSIFKERYIDVDVSSVLMDSQNIEHVISDGKSEVCIKIGDPEVTIVGIHEYEISYHVGGAITYQTYGGADLYWNVTGNEWKVPIQEINAHVVSEDAVMVRERACYRGSKGDSGSCNITVGGDGDVYFSGRVFNPGEGMTVAQGLDRTKIQHDVRERYKLGVILFLVTPLMLGLFGYSIYRYKTKFKTGRTIIPQYEPYPGVKPMYAGYLFDKRLDPRDITAGIVYLAEQGFIKIKKIDRKVLFFFEVDDYEINLTSKPFGDFIGEFDKRILALLFGGYTMSKVTVTLGELKNDHQRQEANYALLRSLKQDLEKDLKNNGFFTNFFFTRRTRKGFEALDHLKGFKEFLSVTESQRYIFHNAPERNAEHFMEYLPYAIAFGVEKQWAKTFEGITIPNPDWYDGGSVNTFSAVSLSQSLGGFSTAFASSSGASASGGGGSSGGGSGGGGGGSW
ncbi:MAG: DUF2207 domain-containing protein [Candidatus Pacebacteria bacterium]|nr:DUF2207 domain-containing protein [Candidatus Paceibacterota bacterium]MCF7857642.1 DUF2207 domain-containing protein [Candidatus Paceibacterota bacterium]